MIPSPRAHLSRTLEPRQSHKRFLVTAGGGEEKDHVVWAAMRRTLCVLMLAVVVGGCTSQTSQPDDSVPRVSAIEYSPHCTMRAGAVCVIHDLGDTDEKIEINLVGDSMWMMASTSLALRCRDGAGTTDVDASDYAEFVLDAASRWASVDCESALGGIHLRIDRAVVGSEACDLVGSRQPCDAAVIDGSAPDGLASLIVAWTPAP